MPNYCSRGYVSRNPNGYALPQPKRFDGGLHSIANSQCASGSGNSTGGAGLITSAEALGGLIEKLASVGRVAVDTEADSLHCYFEKLCLLQISVPGSDALVDPLADLSLEPLWQVFAEKEIILHGADFDLRMLRRAGFNEVKGLFDTMIAARLTGSTEFSLAALVAREFGVTLVKGSQKANWAMRPLSPQMAEYAINDTRFLLPLAEKLEEELRRLERWEWFRQSCEKAIVSAAATRERDIENLWRISGSSDLSDRAAAVLRALWRWRDEEARSVDRPPFHILQNHVLLDAAARFDRGEPVDVRHLRGSRNKRFFEAAEQALQLPESEWPKPLRKPRRRQTSGEQQLFNVYKSVRDKAAVRLKLDPSLIAPKAMLEALSMDLEGTRARLLSWQRDLLEL